MTARYLRQCVFGWADAGNEVGEGITAQHGTQQMRQTRVTERDMHVFLLAFRLLSLTTGW